MENFTPYSALVGGALIGLSATLLLILNGRIAGISGIVNGLFTTSRAEAGWRASFFLGLILGGGLYLRLGPAKQDPRVGFPIWVLMLAGFMVGVGTRMGNGCTSGHGVCGIARLSRRSMAATAVFLASGMLSVYFNHLYLNGS